MADDVVLNPGAGGDTIAADDVAGVKYQVVKLAVGADGAAALVANANPIPVSDAGGALTVDGTVAVTHAALTELAGAIDTELQCDIVSSALPTGAATAAKQPALGTAGSASADVITVQGVASMTPLDVAIASGGITARAEDAAAAGGEDGVMVLAVRRDSASSGVSADGDFAALSVTSDGSLRTAISNTVTVGSHAVTNAGTFAVQVTPATSGGLTIFRSIDLDETEEEIKGSAGQLYFIHAMNMANAVRYLKLYNATAANVTVGTTTPVLTFPLPTMADTNGAGFTVAIPQGLAFGTAITAAATTGLADNDTGAPGASEVVVNIGYA